MKVFISYHIQNRDFVDNLTTSLREIGIIPVIIDLGFKL